MILSSCLSNTRSWTRRFVVCVTESASASGPYTSSASLWHTTKHRFSFVQKGKSVSFDLSIQSILRPWCSLSVIAQPWWEPESVCLLHKKANRTVPLTMSAKHVIENGIGMDRGIDWCKVDLTFPKSLLVSLFYFSLQIEQLNSNFFFQQDAYPQENALALWFYTHSPSSNILKRLFGTSSTCQCISSSNIEVPSSL